MYTFTTEKRPNHAIVHYERFHKRQSGLIVPSIIGSTILRTMPDPDQPRRRSGIMIPSSMQDAVKPSLTLEAQVAQAAAAAQKPSFTTLSELKEGSIREWQDIFEGLSSRGEVPEKAYEEQMTVMRDTPDQNATNSGLIVIHDAPEIETAMSTPQEFDRFVASPDELDVITAITAAVQKMIGVQQNPNPDSTTFM